MTPLVVVAALVAGAVGALLRYGIAQSLASGRAAFPWAVLVVNVGGSLIGGAVLGALQSSAITADVRLIALSGFAGGFTTFSTFSVETLQLTLTGQWRTAALSVGANLVLGIAAAVLGFAVAVGVATLGG